MPSSASLSCPIIRTSGGINPACATSVVVSLSTAPAPTPVPRMSSRLFIVAAKRTAFGSFGGKLMGMTATELSVHATKAALAAGNVPALAIGSVTIGNVQQANRAIPPRATTTTRHARPTKGLPPAGVRGVHDLPTLSLPCAIHPQTSGDAAYLARHVALKCGMAESTPALNVNRLCGSGFQAVVTAAHEILLGEVEVRRAPARRSHRTTAQTPPADQHHRRSADRSDHAAPQLRHAAHSGHTDSQPSLSRPQVAVAGGTESMSQAPMSAYGHTVRFGTKLGQNLQVSSHGLGRVRLVGARACRWVWPARAFATPAPQIELTRDSHAWGEGGHGRGRGALPSLGTKAHGLQA